MAAPDHALAALAAWRVSRRVVRRMAPVNDDKIVEEFIRVDRLPSSTRIFVGVVTWLAVSEPRKDRVEVASLPAEASASDIAGAVANCLEDRRWFGTCDDCGERNPVGWMDEPALCMGCDERNHGAVH